MRNLAAILLVSMIVILPSCKYFKGKRLFGHKADTMAVWQARQDSIRVADSIRKAQDAILAAQQAKLDSINAAEEQRKAWESKYKYNIIVGSFVTPEYARALAESYKQKGYDARILKMQGSKFELVSAEANDRFSKAVERLKAFQDTVEIDSWMYIIK